MKPWVQISEGRQTCMYTHTHLYHLYCYHHILFNYNNFYCQLESIKTTEVIDEAHLWVHLHCQRELKKGWRWGMGQQPTLNLGSTVSQARAPH